MRDHLRTTHDSTAARAVVRAFGRKCAAAALPLAGLATAVAIAAGGDGPTRTTLTATSTSGPISIQDSRAGSAILTAGPMKPGDSVQGLVTIVNSGSAASLRLSESNLTDEPGRFGGALSSRLQITVEDLSKPVPPVYSGPLGSLPNIALGSFAQGAKHTYRFTATLPNGGPPPSSSTGDNLYQGSRTTVEFDWTASGPAPPKPVLTFKAAGVQTFGKGVKVSSSCTLACKLRIAGSVAIAGSKTKYSLPTVSLSLPRSIVTRTTLVFSKATRTAIAAALIHHKKVTATVSGTLAGGTPQKRTVVITKG